MRGWGFVLAGVAAASACEAAQGVIEGPPGSGIFGASVTVLPNGNFVVTDRLFDAPGPIADVGAVYLYSAEGVLISTLRGSNANDQVGNAGVIVLANGNYVVRSGVWRNGAATSAGAVTFGSMTGGVEGVVSAANSLVGTSSGDSVGADGIVVLNNGNYVVRSSLWNNAAIADAGAVTFGSGTTGVSGAVSAANSLVGSHANDQVGQSVIALASGNYVVQSPVWDNEAAADAGAATFGSGTVGVVGAVSPANSLVGAQAGDNVGLPGITALSNGNYVVASAGWNSGVIADVGAATFGSGTSGVSGTIGAGNSLVGSRANDRVGSSITALSNGNYVVRSPNWDDGSTADAGAATFGSGTSGVAGTVSGANSLIGSRAGDQVGSAGTALANGHYVVQSPLWDNGATVNVGAVTFASGTSGRMGTIDAGNSLIGSRADDQVGSAGVTALSNGSYVVRSPNWDDGTTLNVGAATFGASGAGVAGVVSSANSLIGAAPGDGAEAYVTALANGNYVVGNWRWNNGAVADAGAVTFGSGSTGVSGVISAGNSLVGTQANDNVGFPPAVALATGGYVVASPNWDRTGITNVGAATFAPAAGITGAVSLANSLVGSAANDRAGAGIDALSDGDYVVRSPSWDFGPAMDFGAATWGSGSTGVTGEVSVLNSLVGSSAGDQLGNSNLSAAVLSDGHYVVASPLWNNGAINDAGALTLGLGDGSTLGTVTAQNSVTGIVATSGFNQVFGYDPARTQLVVGQPNGNRVVLHRPDVVIDAVFADGYEDASP